ncbi:hypothetical protein BJV74DRAFT_862308 [Russula compacta]|nr:hypothetical protein BJV74DRAFT_862308 [Russula compacta]
MFSLPQPSGDEPSDELPIVPLSEDSEVLNSLISMLYAVPSEMPNSNNNVLSLLAAAEKYDMVSVQSSIRAEVSRRGLLSPTHAEAFRLYAIACRKRLVPEMETAARLTLDYPLTFISLGETLRSFEGWALRDLSNFRLRCMDNLSSHFKSLLDGRNGPSKIWVGCPTVRTSGPEDDYENHDYRLPTWLEAYLRWRLTQLNTFTRVIPKPRRLVEEYLIVEGEAFRKAISKCPYPPFGEVQESLKTDQNS